MGVSSDLKIKTPESTKTKNEAQIPKEPLNEIDVNQLPYKNVKNRELYLLKLISKKLLITDSHLSDGLKPSDEENMIMTRLNIEIEEQMKKIFYDKKQKKKLKIRTRPDAPSYKYNELKTQIEIADWQWEDLNGEHEEYKKLMEEKKKQDDLIKLRGLHRQDLFYPDDEDEEDYKNIQGHKGKNNKNNIKYFQNQDNNEEEEEEN